LQICFEGVSLFFKIVFWLEVVSRLVGRSGCTDARVTAQRSQTARGARRTTLERCRGTTGGLGPRRRRRPGPSAPGCLRSLVSRPTPAGRGRKPAGRRTAPAPVSPGTGAAASPLPKPAACTRSDTRRGTRSGPGLGEVVLDAVGRQDRRPDTVDGEHPAG
jgi:hypothetical protein